MAQKAYSSIGTFLYFGTERGSLTKLCKIKSTPDKGGEPNMLQTTDLEDSTHTYELGVQDISAMTYTANYTPEDLLRLKATERTAGFFEERLGDDSGKDGIHSWEGQYVVYKNGDEVDGVREMTIVVSPSSQIAFTYTAP